MQKAKVSTSPKSIGLIARTGRPRENFTFSVRGSGAFDNPQLQANASLSNLTLGGESIGALEFVAHAANRSLAYDLTTRLDTPNSPCTGRPASTATTKPRPESSSPASISIRCSSLPTSRPSADNPACRYRHGRRPARASRAAPRRSPPCRNLMRPLPAFTFKSEGGVHATLGQATSSRPAPHHRRDTDLRACKAAWLSMVSGNSILPPAARSTSNSLKPSTPT